MIKDRVINKMKNSRVVWFKDWWAENAKNFTTGNPSSNSF